MMQYIKNNAYLSSEAPFRYHCEQTRDILKTDIWDIKRDICEINLINRDPFKLIIRRRLLIT